MADIEKGAGRAETTGTNGHSPELGVENGDQSKELSSDFDLEEYGEENGYILDLDHLRSIAPNYEGVKLAKDGHTILIPQPSDDPQDPLNWTWGKKHIVLFVLSCTSFLPDYGSATGAVTLLPQSKIWGISEDTVNHSQAGNVFMLGAGGLFIVVFSAYFGRLPVLFWFTLTTVWTAAWCTGAASFNSFMAARILNGFFSTVAQSGGLMFIKDIFFFHEHARKINIWASFIILSPYFGPLITAFIISTQKWQWGFAVYTIMTGLCLIGQILFMDETFYNRKIPAEERYPRKSRFQRLIGTEQWKSRSQRSTFKQAVTRLTRVISKPTLVISCLYYLFTFAWAVGINTTLSIFVTPLYNFGPKQIGFFYFTPVVAVILGQVVGHWLHDFLAKILAKRNNGTFQPEYRLAAIWISNPLVIAGLIILGFSLDLGLHYMVAAVGWGLYVFGMMVTTVALTAYNLDSYPEGSGEVNAWLNFSRTLGGFIVSYEQVTWANAQGTRRSFGIQAGVCLVAFGFVILLQIFGHRLRRWSGPLKFKTA